MLRTKTLSKPEHDYLTYLNDWLYKNLSGASHLSLLGLMERGGHLVRFLYQSEDEEAREATLERYRSNCVGTTIILLVALLSELQMGLGYDLGDRCRFLWTMLSSGSGAADEIYKLRYQAAL